MPGRRLALMPLSEAGGRPAFLAAPVMPGALKRLLLRLLPLSALLLGLFLLLYGAFRRSRSAGGCFLPLAARGALPGGPALPALVFGNLSALLFHGLSRLLCRLP